MEEVKKNSIFKRMARFFRSLFAVSTHRRPGTLTLTKSFPSTGALRTVPTPLLSKNHYRLRIPRQ